VIEKVGFQKEGIMLHKQKNADGDFQDLQIAVFSRDDYLRSDIKEERIKAYSVLDEVIST
jgi:hypothetical protein